MVLPCASIPDNRGSEEFDSSHRFDRPAYVGELHGQWR